MVGPKSPAHESDQVITPLVHRTASLVPAWVNPWKGRTSTWSKQETSDALADILDVGKMFKEELCYLAQLSQHKTQLWELPWEDMADKIANCIGRRGASLETADALMDLDHLCVYIKAWMQQFDIVRKIINWNLFEHNVAARKLAVLCRPGAYLADFVFTLVAVERGHIKPTSAYAVIHNHVYVKLAVNLGIVNSTFCSENNVGNVLECLFWFAYEQCRYEFIISVVHHAAQLQLDNNLNCLVPSSILAEDMNIPSQQHVALGENHLQLALDCRTCSMPLVASKIVPQQTCMHCRKQPESDCGTDAKHACRKLSINTDNATQANSSSGNGSPVIRINVRKRVVPSASPPWHMPAEAKTSSWTKHETWNGLQAILDTGNDMKHELGFLVAMSKCRTKLCELPWVHICQKIAHGTNRRGAKLDTSEAIMNVEQLADYVSEWIEEVDIVKKLVNWNLFHDADAALNLAVLCRPGTYLADLMFTLVAIERDSRNATLSYLVISTRVYVELAARLCILHERFCSEFNVTNVMECLMWLAFEQGRYEFIITVVHHAANIQLDITANVVPGAMEPAEKPIAASQQELVNPQNSVDTHWDMYREQRHKRVRSQCEHADLSTVYDVAKCHWTTSPLDMSEHETHMHCRDHAVAGADMERTDQDCHRSITDEYTLTVRHTVHGDQPLDRKGTDVTKTCLDIAHVPATEPMSIRECATSHMRCASQSIGVSTRSWSAWSTEKRS